LRYWLPFAAGKTTNPGRICCSGYGSASASSPTLASASPLAASSSSRFVWLPPKHVSHAHASSNTASPARSIDGHEMSFLPLVALELRAAARRKSTYRIRRWTAVIAFVVSLFFIAIGFFGGREAGKDLFTFLTTFAIGLTLIAGLFQTP